MRWDPEEIIDVDDTRVVVVNHVWMGGQVEAAGLSEVSQENADIVRAMIGAALGRLS